MNKAELEETNIRGTREAFKYIIAALYGIFLTFQGMIYTEIKEINKKLVDSEIIRATQAQEIKYLKEKIEAIETKNNHQDQRLDDNMVFVKPDEITVKNQD